MKKKTQTDLKWALEECTPMELLFGRFMESWAREKLEGIRKEIEEGKIADLVIPDEIEHIESDIFAGCENLKSVTFHSKVLSIGEHAFAGCSSLKSIEIPENVHSVSSASFKDCTSVEHISISGKLLPSLSDIFEGCHAVSTLTLTSDIDFFKLMVELCGDVLSTDEVAEALQMLKSNCSAFTKLTTLELTDKVTEIDPETLAVFTSLKAIKINKKNKVYQSEGKDKLIVEKNTGRLVYAISDDINGNVLGIGPSAFCGHKSLESIFIPKGVIKIDPHAFDGCDVLKSIVVSEDNPIYDSRDGSNAIIETSTSTLVVACSGTVLPKGVTDPQQYLMKFLDRSCETLVIPEGITYIGRETLAGFNAFTSIVIPSTVSNIDPDAFNYGRPAEYIKVSPDNPVYDSREDCNAIVLIETDEILVPSMNTTIPKSVDEYMIDDFYRRGLNDACHRLYLKSLGITYDPDSDTVVVDGEADECVLSVIDTQLRSSHIIFNCNIRGCASEDYWWWARELKTIYIGKHVEHIDVEVFAMAYKLEKITVCPENDVFDSREDCNAIIEKETDRLLLGCMGTVIPDGIKSIRMFSSSKSELKLPESVEVIEDGAFFECENLYQINIPIGLKKIGADAFYKCPLYDVIVPDSVIEIGDTAFFGLSCEVQLPDRFNSHHCRIFGRSEDVEDYFWDSLK